MDAVDTTGMTNAEAQRARMKAFQEWSWQQHLLGNDHKMLGLKKLREAQQARVPSLAERDLFTLAYGDW